MRGFLSVLFILVIVLMSYPFLFSDDQPGNKLTGLPWQIDVTADGHTRVFGISPGYSSLADAVASLGDDHVLAIVSSQSGSSLEMFFGHYRVGLMSAKVVMLAEATEDQISEWMQNSPGYEHMQSGQAKQFTLSERDKAAALAATIKLVTFIPAVNLDDEIIRKRFGEPAQVLDGGEGVTHYLFDAKGLVITLHEEGKEVLQYISPASFGELIAPLKQH